MRCTGEKTHVLIAIIFVALLAVRVPFYFTHHVQEDAYITLRCAESLAETGVYGFNPGERVSSSTSHLYVFISAVVYLVVGKEALIPAMQVINSILFIAGAYFLANVLSRSKKSVLILWGLLSLLPISLQISYSGMETSLLIFSIGLILYLLQIRRHHWLALVSLALLPWIRPEAIAYSLIIVFWDGWRDKKIRLNFVGAILAGMAGLLAFNRLYFGSFLNQSILAKAQSRHAFSTNEMLSTVKLVFWGENGGLFSPIRTRYLDDFGIVFLAIVFIAMVIFLFRYRKDKPVWFASLTLISMALLIPTAYAAGRVIFQWYFWPATFMGLTFLCALLADWISTRRKWGGVGWVLISLAVIAGLAAQWVFSYSWGMKEYSYRGGIGKQLASMAEEGDTLFLEPAGYIPYYSGLYTYDEAGLVSPLISHYRELYRWPWWFRFVEEVKPDWIVQRGHFSNYTTYQGYTLSIAEQRWFNENYHLVKLVSYDPQDYASNSPLIQILSLGTADDYYIYEINR